MKIEWLNDDLTRARVTRGWFRKYTATVYRKAEPFVSFNTGKHDGDWRFDSSDDWLGWWICRSLDREHNRVIEARRKSRNWQPVERLPAARLVKP